MNLLKNCIYLIRVLITGASFLISSCGDVNSNQSNLAITNGAPASFNELPAIVKIFRREENLEPVLCTGTFVSQTQILTAAHCGGDRDHPIFEIVWTSLNGDFISTSSNDFIKHPLYTPGHSIQPNDIAIITIDRPSESVPDPLVLATNPVAQGQTVSLVGFGDNKNENKDGKLSGTGAGIKRIGANKIYAATHGGLLIVSGDPGGCDTSENSSVTGNGDSGAPLLVDGNIAGTTIGGGILAAKEGQTCPKSVSYFTNLQLEINLTFLKESLK